MEISYDESKLCLETKVRINELFHGGPETLILQYVGSCKVVSISKPDYVFSSSIVLYDEKRTSDYWHNEKKDCNKSFYFSKDSHWSFSENNFFRENTYYKITLTNEFDIFADKNELTFQSQNIDCIQHTNEIFIFLQQLLVHHIPYKAIDIIGDYFYYDYE